MEGSGHRPAQYGCPTRCISIDHINNAVLGCASLPHARPGVQVHRRLHCDLLHANCFLDHTSTRLHTGPSKIAGPTKRCGVRRCTGSSSLDLAEEVPYHRPYLARTTVVSHAPPAPSDREHPGRGSTEAAVPSTRTRWLLSWVSAH